MAKRKKIFRWYNISITVLYLPIALYLLWLGIVSYKIESIKNELRENGYPVTFEDLAKEAAKYAEEENAIDYIMKAGALTEWPVQPGSSEIDAVSVNTKEEFPEFGYMPEDFFNLSEEDKEKLAKYLEVHNTQLEALNKAIEIGRFQAIYHWEDGINATWDGLLEIKQATKLVKYLTISYMNDGQIDTAINLITKWNCLLYKSAKKKPISMIETLVINSCQKIVDDIIFWAIKSIDLSNRQLTELYNITEPVKHTEILPKVFETERVYSFWGFDDYIYSARESLFSNITELEARFYVYSGLVKLNSIKHCEYLEKYISACSSISFYEAYSGFKKASMQELDLSNNFIYKPLEFTSPFERFILLYGKYISSKNILKVIIANEIYKNENGEYARDIETLREINKDLVINDIFTANDLLGYKTLAKEDKIEEYVIWSKTDKSPDKLEEIIAIMISDELHYSDDLPDEYNAYDTAIFRIKAN